MHNRELDALVAEKVMGVQTTQHEGRLILFPGSMDIPHYSTDIAAAWEVVEKLGGESVVLTYGEDTGWWECSFLIGGIRSTGMSKSAPEAICAAALEAVVCRRALGLNSELTPENP